MMAIAERVDNILVVKIGGGAGLDMRRCVADVARLAQERPVVLVHGVSDMMNRLCAERGVPVRTLVSPTGHESRYTDPLTRDLFVEATHLVNAELIALLAEHGIRATGVMNTIQGERKNAIRAMVNGRVVMVRDDYSGSVSSVSTQPILEALQNGLVPVLPPLAMSNDGYLNIDGDRASANVAGALCAEELVILSNVRGLYRQFPDENSLIPRITRPQLDDALNMAQGRMKRKVLGAQEALNGGVNRVIIGDGRADNPILSALRGNGTEFLA
jgi:acetylglutamate/LysW-gamma-L-alpha-aminoadipate kinase